MTSGRKSALASILIVTLLTLAFAFYFDWLMHRRFMIDLERDASRQATTVAHIVHNILKDETDPGVLEAAYRKISEEISALSPKLDGIRITVFDREGTPVADSATDALKLAGGDAEGPRPEVLNAMADGLGFDIRYNPALKTTSLYAGVSDGADGTHITRVAIPLDELLGHRAHIHAMLGIGGASIILVVITLMLLLGRRVNITARVQVEKNRLDALVRARTATLTDLRSLGSMLAVCNDLDDAGQVVGAYIPRLLPGRSGAIALVNASRNLLVIRHYWGEAWPHAHHCPPSDCWALRKSAVHLSTRAEGIICKHLDDAPGDGVSCIPLIAQGEVLGVIHVRANAMETVAEGPKDLTSGGVTFDVARAVGEEVAVAISNLQLRETLKQQALRDALTGLYNRRFLDEHFAYEVARASRHEKPMALLVIDVDHFKSFNDNYGHDAGDYVLSQIGSQFRDSLRGEDIVCRLGGEEFAAVLAETGREGALEFADKVRRTIEKQELIFQGKSLGHVSISVGVAIFPEHGEDLPTMLKAGDEALYVAKESGRNRVCVAGGSQAKEFPENE